MLKVTIEIIPFGNYSQRNTIEEIYIANVGGDQFKANYDAWLNVDPTDYSKQERPTPDVHLKKYKRQKGAFELVRTILNKLYTKQLKK